ncbi:HPr family phosphocarrier protein [Salinithrix halophila]|uniref:HPr family phosphocarrier protein n=1 Tax=Salinithrix halophila TaxID=1485204 RepID=A0ABV8JJA5_9BACL
MRKKRIFSVLGKPSVREVTRFVETARSFASHIMICHGKITANGKGLLGLISLFIGVEKGDRLILTAAGPDADRALEELVHLFQWVHYDL